MRDDLDQVGEAGNGHHPPLQNGVCREEDVVKGERTGIWVDWTTGEMEDRENLDGTLTNAGQRVVEKTIQVQQRQVNVSRELIYHLKFKINNVDFQLSCHSLSIVLGRESF